MFDLGQGHRVICTISRHHHTCTKGQITDSDKESLGPGVGSLLISRQSDFTAQKSIFRFVESEGDHCLPDTRAIGSRTSRTWRHRPAFVIYARRQIGALHRPAPLESHIESSIYKPTGAWRRSGPGGCTAGASPFWSADITGASHAPCREPDPEATSRYMVERSGPGRRRTSTRGRRSPRGLDPAVDRAVVEIRRNGKTKRTTTGAGSDVRTTTGNRSRPDQRLGHG